MKRYFIVAVSLFVLFSAVTVYAEGGNKDEFPTLGVGLGLGIPYGIFGVNFAYAVIPQVDLMFGVGTTILADTGTSVGARFYFGENSSWRASAIYGTNTIIESPSLEAKSYQGFNLGLGWIQSRKRGGWNVDAILLLTSEGFDEIEKLQKKGFTVSGDTGTTAKLAFGYQWNW